MFSKEAVAFYIPTCDRSSFSTSSQVLGIVTIFFFIFSLLIDVQECLIEVLICASLMLNIFPCAYLPSVFPFHWNASSCPFSIFCCCFFLLLCFQSSLYTLHFSLLLNKYVLYLTSNIGSSTPGTCQYFFKSLAQRINRHCRWPEGYAAQHRLS